MIHGFAAHCTLQPAKSMVPWSIDGQQRGYQHSMVARVASVKRIGESDFQSSSETNDVAEMKTSVQTDVSQGYSNCDFSED